MFKRTDSKHAANVLLVSCLCLLIASACFVLTQAGGDSPLFPGRDQTITYTGTYNSTISGVYSISVAISGNEDWLIRRKTRDENHHLLMRGFNQGKLFYMEMFTFGIDNNRNTTEYVIPPDPNSTYCVSNYIMSNSTNYSFYMSGWYQKGSTVKNGRKVMRFVQWINFVMAQGGSKIVFLSQEDIYLDKDNLLVQHTWNSTMSSSQFTQVQSWEMNVKTVGPVDKDAFNLPPICSSVSPATVDMKVVAHKQAGDGILLTELLRLPRN